MKFGVREICNVVFKATTSRKIGETTFAKGAPVLYFDSLKTSTMEQAVTTVYAQGGRGNTRLIAWDGEKTLTFTMEDALISEMGLAILASAKLYKASDENILNVHVTETVDAGNLKVSKSPASKSRDGSVVEFFILPLDDNGDVCGEPKVLETIEDDKTFVAPDWTGLTSTPSAYLVDYYFEVKENAYQIDIEPQNFGGNFYIEADTLFRDTLGADHAAQFIIPNGKIQSNFTLSMASTGDPSTFTFTVDAFPGYVNGDKTKKVMAAIQVVSGDIADIEGDDAAGDFDNAPATGEEEDI